MQLLHQFRDFILQQKLFSANDHLLLAVSGGVDSVVLCELCRCAGYPFSIAHCNFSLRDAESDADEDFVRSLAKKYGVDVFVRRFATNEHATSNKMSVQVAARELRYQWFDDILQGVVQPGDSHPAVVPKFILTAHHLDDNIETMLMNFFKGTGIAGLRGIQPIHGHIVRPLLFAKKERLQQFAVEQELAWREDSSNQTDKYARNYLRHQLIPLLKNIYPQVEENLADNLHRFKDIEILYHQSVERHLKKLLEVKGAEVHIPVLKLKNTVPLQSIVYEIIRRYGFAADQVRDTITLLESDTGKYIQSVTHRIIKNRQWIIISPNETIVAATILIESTANPIRYQQGTLSLILQPAPPAKISNDPFTALLDASQIQFPLLLRKWKTGDYFYPLGMKKKKKLSRFFIDLKLSKTEKEKLWVLEMNKKIVWIPGYRIDDRFKLNPQTKQTLVVSLKTTDV